MFNKIKNIIFFISFCFFAILMTYYYFSEENIRKTNRNRTSYNFNLKFNKLNLPILENDTNNIIEFKNDIEIYKKNKKKYKFWDLIDK